MFSKFSYSQSRENVFRHPVYVSWPVLCFSVLRRQELNSPLPLTIQRETTLALDPHCTSVPETPPILLLPNMFNPLRPLLSDKWYFAAPISVWRHCTPREHYYFHDKEKYENKYVILIYHNARHIVWNKYLFWDNHALPDCDLMINGDVFTKETLINQRE